MQVLFYWVIRQNNQNHSFSTGHPYCRLFFRVAQLKMVCWYFSKIFYVFVGLVMLLMSVLALALVLMLVLMLVLVLVLVLALALMMVDID